MRNLKPSVKERWVGNIGAFADHLKALIAAGEAEGEIDLYASHALTMLEHAVDAIDSIEAEGE
jgi:hypothetical protein